jgi:hypothetical protein
VVAVDDRDDEARTLVEQRGMRKVAVEAERGSV